MAVRTRLGALCLLAAVQLAGGAVGATAAEPDADAPCRIPFEALQDTKTGDAFPQSAAINENESLADHLRQRYVVASLSTTDEYGYCLGVREFYSALEDLSDFQRLRSLATQRKIEIEALASLPPEQLLAPEATNEERAAIAQELEDLKNYQQQVHRWKADPIVKNRVFNGYCVGQTLNFCEIVNGRPKLVFRFATSSSRWRPPVTGYYAPINFIKSRSWSSDRRYTSADARRDVRLGGGLARTVPFENGGNPIEMPNFLHFLPMPGYKGEPGNGIHQIAGGLDSGGTFGAPVSLGCLRLGRFQSKLARWWTPTQAKLFIHFEQNRYRKFGIASTGKARGFATPGAATSEIANASPPTAPRSKPKTAKSPPDTPFFLPAFAALFSN